MKCPTFTKEQQHKSDGMLKLCLCERHLNLSFVTHQRPMETNFTNVPSMYEGKLGFPDEQAANMTAAATLMIF
ncbi:hypothetical protein E2C01_097705 [Portunus trituberculatus]|uniref:Uncharacterized protein n=1 Tax=Portunus trituberculatus TaxID=210409 RepID=A0A5B7K5J0_PORTR|nr:hypothetical protein [Portunus trituberculatus]